MLFEQEHFGKLISEQLSEYIKANTSHKDVVEVFEKTGVGVSTIKQVTYRMNTLTESNSVAILEMVRKAIANCKTKIEDSLKAKTYLEDQIEKSKAYGT